MQKLKLAGIFGDEEEFAAPPPNTAWLRLKEPQNPKPKPKPKPAGVWQGAANYLSTGILNSIPQQVEYSE